MSSNAYPEVPLEMLFDYQRLKRRLRLSDIFWVIYAPFGIVLSLTRLVTLAATFSTGLFLPSGVVRWLMPKLVRLVLGLIVIEKNKSASGEASKRAPVVVINHITDYDTFVVGSTFNARPVISTVTTTVPIIGPLIKRGYRAFEPIWVPPRAEASDTRNAVRSAIEEHLHAGRQDMPIAMAPEGGVTIFISNGRVGLMLYKRFVFSLGMPVTPLCIQHNERWPINADWLGALWISDMLWLGFFPYHVFTLTWLPVMTIQAGESAEQFARRVQVAMAEELHLVPTLHTYEAKAKHRSKTYGAAQRAY